LLQTKAEAEKQVIEILQKGLQYCDFDEENPKFPLYQYRAAMIHYRIGCLYHSHIWMADSDSANRKNVIQLAKINYEKASRYYFLALDVISYFTSQMQRIALCEYLADSTYNIIIIQGVSEMGALILTGNRTRQKEQLFYLPFCRKRCLIQNNTTLALNTQLRNVF
jgi:hypothetical protein